MRVCVTMCVGGEGLWPLTWGAQARAHTLVPHPAPAPRRIKLERALPYEISTLWRPEIHGARAPRAPPPFPRPPPTSPHAQRSLEAVNPPAPRQRARTRRAAAQTGTTRATA